MTPTEQTKPIRLAITCSVIQKWRYPLWVALSKHPGLDVHFFHGQDVPGSKEINAPNLSEIAHTEISTRHISVKSSGRTSPLKYHWGMVKQLKQFRPDILLCEGGSNIATNLSLFFWARRKRVPILWWGLGELAGRQYSGIVAKTYLRIRRFLERRASGYLGYSQQAKNYFVSQGYPEERCHVALNCVNTDKIEKTIPDDKLGVAALQEQYDLKDKSVILFCGTIIQPKRIDRLLHSFARITEQFPDTRLLIVGDGPYREQAEEIARTLGLTEQVIFTGAVWDAPGAYFELADFFVLPGLGGLAICEAMAHQCPVISAPADGTEIDYIQPGVNGHLLKHGTEAEMEQELASYMKKMLADPQAMETMGQAARDFILTTANTENYVHSIWKCITETLARPARW